MIIVTSSLLEIKYGADNYSNKPVALLQNCNRHMDIYQHILIQVRVLYKMTSKGNKHIIST